MNNFIFVDIDQKFIVYVSVFGVELREILHSQNDNLIKY